MMTIVDTFWLAWSENNYFRVIVVCTKTIIPNFTSILQYHWWLPQRLPNRWYFSSVYHDTKESILGFLDFIFVCLVSDKILCSDWLQCPLFVSLMLVGAVRIFSCVRIPTPSGDVVVIDGFWFHCCRVENCIDGKLIGKFCILMCVMIAAYSKFSTFPVNHSSYICPFNSLTMKVDDVVEVNVKELNHAHCRIVYRWQTTMLSLHQCGWLWASMEVLVCQRGINNQIYSFFHLWGDVMGRQKAVNIHLFLSDIHHVCLDF